MKPSKADQRHIFWLLDEDVAAARRVLAVLGQVSDAEPQSRLATGSGTEIDRSAALEQAQLLLSLRRRRIQLFGSRFSFEGPFLIMLALFAIEDREPEVNITRLNQLTVMNMSTALRWLAELEKMGLIERGSIWSDERLVRIALTDKGRNSIASFFNVQDHDGER